MAKHLLYVIPYPRFFSQHGGVGGHVAHAAGIINGFIEHGFDINVLAEEHHEIFEIDGVDVELVPNTAHFPISRQFWAIKLLVTLRRILKRQQFDFCYIRYSASFAPWIPVLKWLLGPVPLILEVNSLGSQWKPALRQLDRFALAAADRIICVSQILYDQIFELLGREAGSADLRLVINGVNASRFKVAPVYFERSGATHVGYAGLLKPDYGVEDLISAIRLLQGEKVFLHIFGDGPHRALLEALASDVENVQFHGPVPFLDMPAHLSAMDILVYTTGKKYIYQSPTKLFEYMASAKPIIAARTPQTELLLKNAETGFFFEVGQAEAIAQRIRQLDGDIESRLVMGALARREAEQEHSWTARVAQILSND